MRKAPLVMAAAATLGLATIAAPAPAQALARRILPGRGWRAYRGGGDRRIASSAYAYGPGYGYYDGYAPGIMVMAVDTPRPTTAAITAVATAVVRAGLLWRRIRVLLRRAVCPPRVSSGVRLLSASSVLRWLLEPLVIG